MPQGQLGKRRVLGLTAEVAVVDGVLLKEP